MEEPGVGVFFHQAVDYQLGGFETALCGLCYDLLNGCLGVVVNVDLNNKRNEKQSRIMTSGASTTCITSTLFNSSHMFTCLGVNA